MLINGDTIPEADWLDILARSPGAAERWPLYGRLGAPSLVLGRIAQTLDGRIAATGGASFWISGKQDVLHTHRLRALFDAVVVGARTVRADDPLLTTRHCVGPSPVRVVLDTDRRLEPRFQLFRSGPRTLLVCAEDAAGPEHHGAAEVVRVARAPATIASSTGLSVPAILAALQARGLRRLFVEGGGVTVSRFLAAGALDRLHVTVAPLLLGGGVPAFTLPAVERPEDGVRLDWTMHRLGGDVLFDIALRPSA